MNFELRRRCALTFRGHQKPIKTYSRLDQRCLHVSSTRAANPLPVTGSGPPPAAPMPVSSGGAARLARQRKQAELLKRGQELRKASEPTGASKPGSALRKRFWEDVSVQQQEDGGHIIYLDQRPVRIPTTKDVLAIPSTKPHLASAIALEWDSLTSAQQALKGHYIPLTSIVSRAVDIEAADAQIKKSGSTALSSAREEVVKVMLRYLDTDTLLCWAPERSFYDTDASSTGETIPKKKISLRDKQVRVAQDIIAHLNTTVWPGVVINPVLDTDSIIPTSQPQETKHVIRGWVSGLPAWELAGLERAVLATKSLCVATRLLIDWAEAFRDLHAGVSTEGRQKFGIEEATEACSLEVTHQTGVWGEVEDTHDVDKEDLKRQLGSVVLLVSGVN